MEAHAHDDLALSRIRAEFDQWRAGRSGRGRIPDRLWRLAVSLLDSFSTAVVCKELRLSAGDLRKHRQALDTKTPAPKTAVPSFVELRAVDLTPTSPKRTPGVAAPAPPVRAVIERGDGSRLTLDLAPATPALLESVITMLRSSSASPRSTSGTVLMASVAYVVNASMSTHSTGLFTSSATAPAPA
jgi:hypothetical protein